jgi:ubiquitin-activating enzyme E1
MSSNVDQNLYSRQIGVFGMETMGKLIQMNVLVVGLRGLGVEIAKNLILAGPKSVALFDNAPVSIDDLGCNYYLTPGSVGEPRASSCVSQLAELNSYVHTHVITNPELTDAIVSSFHVVVFTNGAYVDLIKWNAFCRAQSPQIGFIASSIYGAAGMSFTDFGNEHVVFDLNGELPRSAIVVDVTQSSQATVFTHDAKRHGFEENDVVAFREVEGMKEISGGGEGRKHFRVASVKPYSFVLDLDSTNFEPYRTGGIVEQVKVPIKVSFGSFAAGLGSPVLPDDPLGMMITPDLGKFGRSEQLHIAFQAVEV